MLPSSSGTNGPALCACATKAMLPISSGRTMRAKFSPPLRASSAVAAHILSAHRLATSGAGGVAEKFLKRSTAETGAGGGGGIRTHGGVAPTAVFKTAALNHSATPPLRAEGKEQKAE